MAQRMGYFGRRDIINIGSRTSESHRGAEAVAGNMIMKTSIAYYIMISSYNII